MKVTLTVPDATYEHYADYAAQLGGKASVEDILAAQLEAFSKVRPTDRIVVVDTRSRDRLESMLPGGSIRDAADLVARVDRLAKVEVGEIRVPFTPRELEELAYRARGQGRPIRDLVADAVQSFHDHYFNWPDTRRCPECELRKNPPPPPVPEVKPEPLPLLLDVAGKVAAAQGLPTSPIRPIPPAAKKTA